MLLRVVTAAVRGVARAGVRVNGGAVPVPAAAAAPLPQPQPSSLASRSLQDAHVVRRMSSASTLTVPAQLDTHKLVVALREVGFTEVQSEVIVDTFIRVTEHGIEEQKKQLATKFEFVNLKSELQLLGKSDFVLLRNDLALMEKKTATELANVRTEMERIENRFIKWAVGASTTVVALLFSYSRLKQS